MPDAEKPGFERLAPNRSFAIFAGASGWAYPSWKPGFFPGDVSSRKFLSFYSSKLDFQHEDEPTGALHAASLLKSLAR